MPREFRPVLPLVAALVACQTLGAGAVRAIADSAALTVLGAQDCREAIDETDPDETPYLLCPGPAGYGLIERQAGSGRVSLDIRTPAGKILPLRLDEVVTQDMADLAPQVEWRLGAGSPPRPVALIARVRAHGSLDDPAAITETWVAVAKLTHDAACVTDRIRAGTQSEAELRERADRAADRPCLPPLSPGSGG